MYTHTGLIITEKVKRSDIFEGMLLHAWHYKHLHVNVINNVIYTLELIREQYLFWIESWQGELKQAKDIDIDW